MKIKVDWSKISGWAEQWLPLIFAMIAVTITFIYLSNHDPLLGDEFDNILNAVITFASICVGFLGVLMGILFSLGSSISISLFLSRADKNGTIKEYFSRPIISGMLVVVMGILLYIRNGLKMTIFTIKVPYTLEDCIIACWIGLITYLIAATYRIINAMMYVLFSHTEKDKELELEKKSNKSNSNEVKELENKYPAK